MAKLSDIQTKLRLIYTTIHKDEGEKQMSLEPGVSVGGDRSAVFFPLDGSLGDVPNVHKPGDAPASKNPLDDIMGILKQSKPKSLDDSSE